MAHVLWWWWWEREGGEGGKRDTQRQRQIDRDREREEGREGTRERDVSCNHTRRNCNHLNVESNSQHISVHSTRHLVAVRSKIVSEERVRRGLRFQCETMKAESDEFSLEVLCPVSHVSLLKSPTKPVCAFWIHLLPSLDLFSSANRDKCVERWKTIWQLVFTSNE